MPSFWKRVFESWNLCPNIVDKNILSGIEMKQKSKTEMVNVLVLLKPASNQSPCTSMCLNSVPGLVYSHIYEVSILKLVRSHSIAFS